MFFNYLKNGTILLSLICSGTGIAAQKEFTLSSGGSLPPTLVKGGNSLIIKTTAFKVADETGRLLPNISRQIFTCNIGSHSRTAGKPNVVSYNLKSCTTNRGGVHKTGEFDFNRIPNPYYSQHKFSVGWTVLCRENVTTLEFKPSVGMSAIIECTRNN